MNEYLENLANENNWGFKYSTKSYANLNTTSNPLITGINLIVEPITINSKFDVMGNETMSFQGALSLLIPSDYDDTGYESRYENYIKPIIDEGVSVLKKRWGCDYTINSFSSTEVIKLFDRNMDGIYVKYVVTEDV